MSSGISAQVSSAGWSGVVSMASAGAVDDDGVGSGFFSLLFSGGGFGGCVEDMAETRGEDEVQ